MLPERKPNRLKGYDYSRDNLYFVTSCVQGMVCCFGKISNRQMHLNEYGEIAHGQWEWLINQYPYTRSHAFVVMPNHVHGIIEIDSSLVNNRVADVEGFLTEGKTTKIKSLS